MSSFPNLTLVYKAPKAISNKYEVRIYRSDFSKDKYRYHLGFSQDFFIEPVRLMLETTAFIGEKHHDYIDGFYIYWFSVVELKHKSIPFDKLTSWLKNIVNDYNKVCSILKINNL